MAHCDGYRVAAVARSTAVASVGIDAEPHAPLPARVERLVVRPEERRMLDRLTASHPAVAWDRLLFSAKESTYKTWCSLTGYAPRLSDCLITPDPENGTFRSLLDVPAPMVTGHEIDHLTGHWRIATHHGSTYVATMIAVSARHCTAPFSPFSF
jgi:4'-phosphopantetheinyl transferase EntD